MHDLDAINDHLTNVVVLDDDSVRLTSASRQDDINTADGSSFGQVFKLLPFAFAAHFGVFAEKSRAALPLAGENVSSSATDDIFAAASDS